MERKRRRSPDNSKRKSSILQNLIESPDSKKKKVDSDGTLFNIKLDISKRFNTTKAKDIIGKVLNNLLYDKQYSEETEQQFADTIANTVRKKLQGEKYERYKLVVDVKLGEMKGQGVNVGNRCLWDPETDWYASDTFINECLLCLPFDGARLTGEGVMAVKGDPPSLEHIHLWRDSLFCVVTVFGMLFY